MYPSSCAWVAESLCCGEEETEYSACAVLCETMASSTTAEDTEGEWVCHE